MSFRKEYIFKSISLICIVVKQEFYDNTGHRIIECYSWREFSDFFFFFFMSGGTNSWDFSGGTWRRKWHPLQYCCLENPMDRGAWWATVREDAKSQTRLRD